MYGGLCKPFEMEQCTLMADKPKQQSNMPTKSAHNTILHLPLSRTDKKKKFFSELKEK